MMRLQTSIAACALLLFAAGAAHARQVLRYAPPSPGGFASLTLTMDDNRVSVAESVALADGALVVLIEVDDLDATIHTYVHLLDAADMLVDSFEYLTDLPVVDTDLQLDWNDGAGGSDRVGASIWESAGADFGDTGGAEYHISLGLPFSEARDTDVTLSESDGLREMQLYAGDNGRVTLSLFHPSTGEIELVSSLPIEYSDRVVSSYDPENVMLTLRSDAIDELNIPVSSGSVLTARLELDSGLETVGYFALD